MGDYKAFNPAKVGATFGLPGVPGAKHRVRGFGVSSMIKVEFDSDFGEVAKSADGLNRHVDLLDRSGTVEITLGQHSESNAFFSGLVAANVPVPFTLTDKSSVADIFTTGSLKIRKVPKMEKGKSNTENVWVFQFTKGTMDHTGAFA